MPRSCSDGFVFSMYIIARARRPRKLLNDVERKGHVTARPRASASSSRTPIFVRRQSPIAEQQDLYLTFHGMLWHLSAKKAWEVSLCQSLQPCKNIFSRSVLSYAPLQRFRANASIPAEWPTYCRRADASPTAPAITCVRRK